MSSAKKKPRSATNASGLYGVVIRGLPNHLHTQRLGEDNLGLYQFHVCGQAKTPQHFMEDHYVLLASETGVCSPLHPPPIWAMGKSVSALAIGT